MSAFDVIDEVRLGSSASSVTFSSIPATYKDLCVIASTRSDNTGTSLAQLALQVNSNTGNSYPVGIFQFNGGTTGTGSGGSGTIYSPSGWIAPNSGATGRFAPTYWYMHDYANTGTKKNFTNWSGFQPAVGSSTAEMTSEGWGAFIVAGAVSTLKFFSEVGANSFVTGTVFTLYGVNGP